MDTSALPTTIKMSELSTSTYKNKHNEEKYTITANSRVLELLLAGDQNVLSHIAELFKAKGQQHNKN